MPFPAGVVPVEAIAAKKRAAAERADERAAKLRAEADALLATVPAKATTATK